MPANKSELVALVADLLAEDALPAGIADAVVGMAETEIKTDLRILPMERRADVILATGEDETAAPSDMLTVVSFRVANSGRRHRFSYKTPDVLDAEFCDTPGLPRFYSTEGSEGAKMFVWDRPPDTLYTARLLYMANPALTDDDSTNTILLDHPAVYIYSCLTHAAGAYLRNLALAEFYRKTYQSIVSRVQGIETSDRIGASSIRPHSPYAVRV
jgi:hypothetical protein